MHIDAAAAAGKNPGRGTFLLFLACLGAVFAFLFSPSFQSGVAHFANDSPLGVLKSAAFRMPSGLTGFWLDLNWLGNNGGAGTLNLNTLLITLLGPIGYAKFLP